MVAGQLRIRNELCKVTKDKERDLVTRLGKVPKIYQAGERARGDRRVSQWSNPFIEEFARVNPRLRAESEGE